MDKRAVSVLVGSGLGCGEGISVGIREGEGLGSTVGKSDGSDDGSVVGANDGSVVGLNDGVDDGSRVGAAVGTGVGESDGIKEGPSVGSPVGVEVGCSVGGLVYSTTTVEVDTLELAVAFGDAVILMPVTFATAEVRAEDKLPLLAAEFKSDTKELVRFAALPSYPSSSPSRLSDERATIPAMRISKVKYTSTSFTNPLGLVTFRAFIDVTSSVLESAEIIITNVFFMAICRSSPNVFCVKPIRRIDD